MGQMLIEIVVAVGIIGLVLVGVSDLMTRSIRVVSFQKQKDEALAVIKKKLLEYRASRDLDPEGFYNSMTSGTTTIDPCDAEKPLYRCLVTVEKSVDAVSLTVVGEWQDGGRLYSVSLSQSLAKQVK